MSAWRPVRGVEDFYEVSDSGQVRRTAAGQGAQAGKILKPRLRKKGYLAVVMHAGDVRREAKIHTLVAEVFLPPAAEIQNQVNHIDGDKSNNAVANLEWCTNAENAAHAKTTGLLRPLRGINNPRAKLTESAVRQIRVSSLPGFVLAERFGVSKSLIGAVRRREVWPDVADVEVAS